MNAFAVAIDHRVLPVFVERPAFVVEVLESLVGFEGDAAGDEIAEAVGEFFEADFEVDDVGDAGEVLHACFAIDDAAAGGDDGVNGLQGLEGIGLRVEQTFSAVFSHEIAEFVVAGAGEGKVVIINKVIVKRMSKRSAERRLAGAWHADEGDVGVTDRFGR